MQQTIPSASKLASGLAPDPQRLCSRKITISNYQQLSNLSWVNIMNVGDWVLISTALFLGAVALFVPYLAEIIKRKCFAPHLQIEFELNPPDCHKTRFGNNEPVYYFRFRVINTGKSQAKRCEAVIEELYKADAAGTFQKVKYSPINLI